MELGNAVFGHSRGEFAIDDRYGYLEILRPLFDVLGCDIYGTHVDNEVFEMHPYCWCDNEDCVQCGKGEQANFHYKPTGFTLTWYKYALRDAYMSKNLSKSEFKEIIDRCVAKITEGRLEDGVVVSKPVMPLLSTQYDAAKMKQFHQRVASNSLYGARGERPKVKMMNPEYDFSGGTMVTKKVLADAREKTCTEAPELKPFFKSPYFVRQRQKAKIFETIYKETSNLATPGVLRMSRSAYQKDGFERVQTKGRMIGLTIKKRQWKNYLKLMRGGFGRPMTIKEKHAYAEKLTRRGYRITTVVKALDACKTVRS